MIGFGELRRLSAKWGKDISEVERIYALSWLLSGIFSSSILKDALALVDESALDNAYFADYPHGDSADFAMEPGVKLYELEADLHLAASITGSLSGLGFKLRSISATQSRFEYTGPLGRRSAAQPLVTLRFNSRALHLTPVWRDFINPFTDRIETRVRAARLEGIAAELIANLGKRPRARDIYDLWFIVTYAGHALDRSPLRGLVEEIASKRGARPMGAIDPSHRLVLARGWDSALVKVHNKPDFDSAERTIVEFAREVLGLG